MRYQNPIVNPIAHYWEESIALGGYSNYWKSVGQSARYLVAEYFTANMILLVGLVARILTLRPLTAAISAVYHRHGLKWTLKRAIDIVGSSVGLILATPIFLIVPILIRLDSPGPVFYRQERVGNNRRRRDRRAAAMPIAEDRRKSDRRQVEGFGRPFHIIKFRTMFVDAEKRTGPVWATKNDPRVTRVGAFLRATRIDEIPQLFNVLIGDMSLVGPRPERAYFIKKLRTSIHGYERRLMVKPGVTGLAQVEHKYDESEDDVRTKVKYDLAYIHNFGLLHDIKIMFKTVFVVLAARGI